MVVRYGKRSVPATSEGANEDIAAPAPVQTIEKIVPVTGKLLDERSSITYKFTIGGHQG